MFKISRAVGRNPGAVRSICGDDCHAGLNKGLQCLASGRTEMVLPAWQVDLPAKSDARRQRSISLGLFLLQ